MPVTGRLLKKSHRTTSCLSVPIIRFKIILQPIYISELGMGAKDQLVLDLWSHCAFMGSDELGILMQSCEKSRVMAGR